MSNEVKKVDADMIEYEWDYLMERTKNPELSEFYNQYFIPKTMDETKNEFIERFNFLTLKK